MGKIFFYIASIIILLLVVSAVWPYVNKSFIAADLKKAATYGTKHDLDEIQRLLSSDLEERGLIYDPDELHIEKNGNNTVSITLNYEDKIGLFGIVLKKLEFEVHVKEKNVEQYF